MRLATRTILIRGARQLLTLRGPKGPRRGTQLAELGIIPDGALLIRDGIIEEVGPSRRVENLAAARGAVEVSAAGRVVLPGFVDCHTHLIFPPPATAASGPGGAEPGEEETLRAFVAGTGQRLAWRGRGYLQAMARHGTTTVEAKTGCGPHESAETKVLRVLAVLHRHPLDIVPTFLFRLPHRAEGSADFGLAAADWVCSELLAKIRRRRLARFADVQWDSDPAHEPLFARFLEVAQDLGFACKIHADHVSPAAAVAHAVKHSVASIDHLEHISTGEIDLLAGCSTIATLLPGASFRSGAHAPARALIDAGAAVALGSNYNPRHDPSLSMQTMIALACLTMGMSAAEAISAATVNAAHAIQCAGRVGVLAHGKSADLLFLNASDYRDLAQQLGTNLVHRTMKRGEFIYEEGAVTPRAP